MPRISRRDLIVSTGAAFAAPAIPEAHASSALPHVGSPLHVTLAALLRVPAKDHGLAWLKASLQAAIQLEFMTIPPYLCAMWSIKDAKHPVRLMIRDIVRQEMEHMGLACNLLNTIGGTPSINTPAAAPRYPGTLPGGIHPELKVSLGPLSKGAVHDVFMEIEYPSTAPLDIAQKSSHPTIGAFYDAIALAFRRLPRGAITGQRQIDSKQFNVWSINTQGQALMAIHTIKHQGEGTSQSPAEGTFGAGLAHYYTFGEIFHGRKLIKGPDGHWSFSGDPIEFPEVFPMAEIPPDGYPEAHEFNVAYSAILADLQATWDQGDVKRLASAVDRMKALSTLAGKLMATPLPGGGGNYGPDFRLVT
jgi:hypothetical protein